MGKSKLKQQLKRKLPSEAAGSNSGSSTLSKKQIKKQRRQAAVAAAQSDDDESHGLDGELRDIEDLDFEDAFAAGLAFEQMESFEGALAAFQTAVKARPDHLEALSHLADVYVADEQPQLALKTYLHASKLLDADASIWFRLGLTHMSLEQHDLAINSLKKSLALSAQTLAATEDSEDKEEDQMKAYSVTLAALANCHGEQGDLESAIKVYTDAVAAFPSNGNLHYNLATMLMAKGGDSEQQVVASLERAIECSSKTIEFYEDLIEFLQQTKETKSRQAKVMELQKKVDELKEAEAKAALEKQAKASDEESSDDDDDDENDSEEDDDDEEDE